jgi:hypothetical protein
MPVIYDDLVQTYDGTAVYDSGAAPPSGSLTAKRRRNGEESMVYLIGSVGNSVDAFIGDDNGLPVIALVAATFPALTWSEAGANADNAFGALNDLLSLTAPFNQLGVFERGNGVYRLDLPNAIFAGSGKVRIRGDVSGKHIMVPLIEVGVIEMFFNSPKSRWIG